MKGELVGKTSKIRGKGSIKMQNEVTRPGTDGSLSAGNSVNFSNHVARAMGCSQADDIERSPCDSEHGVSNALGSSSQPY